MPFSDNTPKDLEFVEKRSGLVNQYYTSAAKWTAKNHHHGVAMQYSRKELFDELDIEGKLTRYATKHNRRYTSYYWPLWSRYIRAKDDLELAEKIIADYRALWFVRLYEWIRSLKKVEEEEMDWW